MESQEEIEKEKKIRKLFKQKKGEFVSMLITDNPRFKVYEGVTLTWDSEDQDYELIGVAGHLYFRSDYNNCLKKRKEIIDDIAKIAGNAKKNDRGKNIHSYDKTGDSYFKEVFFEFSGGGLIRVSCMNWSEKITATNVWSDALNVRIVSEKLRKILSNKPY